ncbi:MAG TPA: TadE family protein [Xanthobacteraceae bacterium]|nr:TadE family protein [Xanthobacteraceae bacterium]
MGKLLRDDSGSVIVIYTLVFPLFIVATLGTVDMALMLYEWALTNKAAYVGARTAVVSDPVAAGITTPVYTQSQLQQLGQPCVDAATGQRNVASDGQFFCPTVAAVCTPTPSGGNCTNGFRWDEPAFARIFTAMQNVFPRLQRQNVQIAYQTNNQGFVGQPGGLPMNITVSIQCMTHGLYFIDALLGWTFSPPSGCPASLRGPPIPSFASTLPSEDMVTN